MRATISNAKSWLKDKEYAMGAALAPVMFGVSNALSTVTAHATAGAGSATKMQSVTVADDGSVSFGQGGGTDVKSGFATLLTNSQFVLGAIVAVASLLVIGFGLWRAQKAARELQDNSPMGWASAGAILKGTVVGGVLFAIVGIVLAASAATGSNLFGS